MVKKYLMGCLLGVGFIFIMWQGGMYKWWAEGGGELVGKRIAIDAGHGGIDSGAKYYGRAEKEINLLLAKRLGERLTQAGAEVIYTREDDVDYYTRGKGGKRADLLRRIAMIEAAHADVFISIHCNAASDRSYHGAQVFYHPKRDENKRLAEMMQEELRKIDETDRRQAATNMHVLLLSTLSDVGVLLEVGYLSNEAEAERLASGAYREQVIEGVMRSLFRYFTEKTHKKVEKLYKDDV